jgi:hypothetical protein
MTITHSSLIGDIVTLQYEDYVITHDEAITYIRRNYLNVASVKHIQTQTFHEPDYSGTSRYKVTFKEQ